MKQILYKSITCGFGFLLFLALSFNCHKDDIPVNPQDGNSSSLSNPDPNNLDALALVLSQTRTANLINENTSSDRWVQDGPEYISSDDNLYAYTKRLSPHNGSALLLAQDFNFEIPGNATILSISIKVKRFKRGQGNINDYRVYMVLGAPSYGIFMEKPDLYPATEAEVTYSQNGSGISSFDDTPDNPPPPYQWTPAMINDPDFGIFILSYDPRKGSAVIYYDLLEITVEYFLP